MTNNLNLNLPIKNFNQLYPLIIFFVLVFVQLPWINFEGTPLGDTQGYLDVSKNWMDSDYVYIRPVIYPLFLLLSKINDTSDFGLIVYIQVIFYAMSGALFYKILNQHLNSYNKVLLALLVLVSFMVPQSLYMNEVVLPEMLPLFFILLFIYVLLKPSTLKNSILLGVFILVPVLMKPLWLLLLAFPVLKYMYSDRRLKNFLFGFFFPLALVISLYSLNQYMVAKKGTNPIMASTLDVNLNLALIRMGLIQGSEGTKLYNFLNSKKLLNEIEKRSWSNDQDEYLNFKKLKDRIPWEIREDSNFWKSILFSNTGNLFKFVSFQLSRLSTFYSTSAENGEVIFLPKPLDVLYQRFFSTIHTKYIVSFFFVLFAFVVGIFDFTKLTLNKVLFFLIVGVGVVLSLLTYQDAHFIRMRSVIEPLLVYTVLYAIITSYTYLYKKMGLIAGRSF